MVCGACGEMRCGVVERYEGCCGGVVCGDIRGVVLVFVIVLTL